MRRLIVGVIALLLAGPTVARADVQPYGTNDAGGFRNVLPAGEAGTDNAAQFGQFQATGQRPAHWDDEKRRICATYVCPDLVNAWRHRALRVSRPERSHPAVVKRERRYRQQNVVTQLCRESRFRESRPAVR